MFTKRNLVDIKKSTSKLQDPKKDLTTRIKHLKIILGDNFIMVYQFSFKIIIIIGF